MKKLMLLGVILFSIPLLAQPNSEIPVKSEVKEATVFIKGAQVTRNATADLPAGKTTVRFTNLSPYIDAKSVQVKANGQVMIHAVNHQLNYGDPVKQTEEQEKLNKQLTDLNNSIEMENMNRGVIADEISFLQENKKIGGAERGIDYTNFQQTATFYGKRMTELKNKDIELSRKIKGLNEQKRVLEKQIATFGSSKQDPQGEIIVEIECKTPLRGVAWQVSYYVNNASWFPSYDVRAKSISEPVELVYKANVQQNTKEDWKNVKLKISSLNPNISNVVPQLKTYYLGYYSMPPRYNTDAFAGQLRGKVTDSQNQPLIGANITVKGSTIGTVTDYEGNYSLAIPSNGGEITASYLGYNDQTKYISGNVLNFQLQESNIYLEESVVVGYGSMRKSNAMAAMDMEMIAEDAMPVPLPVVQTENQTSVEFEINTPYTVLSQNKSTVVEVNRYAVPSGYEYYSIPKIDKDAFLLANITNWEQYNLLEGEANIFFEDTYVGKTILDTRNATDTLSLSLGRDKNISVNREMVRNYKTKKIIGSKTEETRAWKITVKNNKSQQVSFVLLDQVPVSTTQEIEVITENLSNGTLNKETGEVKWTLNLQPGESKDVELRYKIRYPKDKSLFIE